MPNRTIQDYATTTSATGSDYILIQNGSVYKKITKSNFFTGYLTDTLADGQILVGNASNDATAVTISGDISIDNLGEVTVLSLGGVAFSAVATSGDYNDLINTPVVASSFISLSDVPNSYTGASLKYVRVNAGETALEFATFPTNISTFTNDSGYITSAALSPYLTSANAALTYQPLLSGTTNYVARWTGANTLGTGVAYDNGTNFGIGTTSPSSLLDISKSETTYQQLRIYNSNNNYASGIKLGNGNNTPNIYQIGSASTGIHSDYYEQLVFANSNVNGTINVNHIHALAGNIPSNLVSFRITNEISGSLTAGFSTTIFQVLGGNTQTGIVGVNLGSSNPTATIHGRGSTNDSTAYAFKATSNNGLNGLEVRNDGCLIAKNLPTSSVGLPTGALWNNLGVINIV